MNANLYKIIFSKVRNAYVVVSDCASSISSPGRPVRSDVLQNAVVQVSLGLSLSFTLMASAFAAPALPQGANVARGAAVISQSGNVMTVNQSTDKAVVNWQSFSIGTDAKVNIVQPSASSTHLSRVTGNDPSVIQGQLNSNGQVVLVNPNGIVVGKDGSVSASSFTASTLNITDDDFMAGKYQYARKGANGEVVNQGKIETKAGGYVALLGAKVTNEGTITSQQGAVYLGAGDAVAVPVTGSGRIKFEVSPAAINTAVTNNKDAVIVAESGQVYMRAASLNDLAVASVQQSGLVDVSGGQGGNVTVLADKGKIKVDGTIKANSTVAAKGGHIVMGHDVETGVLAAQGDYSGAKLEAAKGFVETSGSWIATTGTRVQAAEWLLDPSNITISTGPASGTAYVPNYVAGADSVILASDIASNLNLGTDVTISTGLAGSAGTSDGNITISAAIEKSGSLNAKLTLIANNSITVGARVGKATTDTTSTGKLDIDMTAYGLAPNKLNSRGIILNNVLSANGGVVTLSGFSANTAGDAGFYATPPYWSYPNYVNGAVVFNTNSGIDAAQYNITGNVQVPVTTSGTSSYTTSVGTAAVAFIGNNVSLRSTSSDNSTIQGSTNAIGNFGAGILFVDDSNTTINAVNGKAIFSGFHDTPTSSGVRIGTFGTAGVKTYGDVTIGGQSTTGILNRRMAFRGGRFEVLQGSLTLQGDIVELYDASARLIASANTSVNLIARNILINGTIEGSAAVSVSTASPTTQIALGAADATNVLGLTQLELNKISASQLLIGNTSSASHVVLSTNIQTSSTTGAVTLQTAGNIQFNNYSLTVGGTSSAAFNRLTLNAAGASSLVSATGIIKANGLELLGSSANYNLTNVSSEFSTVSGLVKSANIFHTNALEVGSVGSTVGFKASDTIKIESDSNILVTQKIESLSTSASAIFINAGKSTAAGVSAGGDIDFSGNGQVLVAAGGTVSLLTGSVDGSTGLNTPVGHSRYGSDESTTNYTQALGAGVYAIYRERPVVQLNFNNQTKIYNGLAYTGTNGFTESTANLKNGDVSALPSGTLVAEGTAQNIINAGTYSLSGSGLTSDLGYALEFVAGTLTVQQAELRTSISASNKTYDGNTSVLDSTISLAGLVNGEQLGVTATSIAFDNKNAGTGKTVTATGITLENNAVAANYFLATGHDTATTTADILKRTLTLTGSTVESKIYDGTNIATLTAVGALNNIVTSDVVTVAPTANFSDANAGLNKVVTLTNLSLSGADANNYELSTPATLTADITKRDLIIKGLVGQTRAYTGLTVVTLDTTNLVFDGKQGTDAFSLVPGTGAYADANVGINKNIQITGQSISATTGSLANYNVQYQTTALGTVTKAPITATLTNTTTTYGTVVPLTFTVNGLVNGESVADAGIAISDLQSSGFTSASTTNNVGGYAITASGLTAQNYQVTSIVPGTLNITPATLTFTPVAATKFVTQNDPLPLQYTVSGLVNGDTSSAYSAPTISRAAGESSGTYAISLSGGNAANYTLDLKTNDFRILPAENVNIQLASVSTVYGTLGTPVISSVSYLDDQGQVISMLNQTSTQTWADSAGGSIVISPGLLGVAVNSPVGTYLNAVTATHTGTATSNGNFNAVTVTPGNYDVTKKLLTITANNVERVYDGSSFTSAQASVSPNGFVLGETMTTLGGVTYTGDAINTRNVGSYAIIPTVVDANGSAAANYDIQYVNGTLLTTARPMTIEGLTIQPKEYDGNTNAIANLSNVILNGMVAGDNVYLNSTTATFDNPNAGTGKVVTLASQTISGVDANNYTLINNGVGPSLTYSGAITPKILTVAGVTALDKVYDSNFNATLDTSNATLAGVLSADANNVALSWSNINGLFLDKNVGVANTVNVSGYGLSGAQAANYAFATNYLTTTTASITPRQLTVTATPELSLVDNGLFQNQRAKIEGLQGTDQIEVLGLVSARDVGNYMSNLSLRGALRSNYIALLNNAAFNIIPAKSTTDPIKETVTNVVDSATSSTVIDYVSPTQRMLASLSLSESPQVLQSSMIQDSSASIVFTLAAETLQKTECEAVSPVVGGVQRCDCEPPSKIVVASNEPEICYIPALQLAELSVTR